MSDTVWKIWGVVFVGLVVLIFVSAGVIAAVGAGWMVGNAAFPEWSEGFRSLAGFVIVALFMGFVVGGVYGLEHWD